MENILIVAAIGLLVGFALGVIFHKVVTADAEAIKQHITTEVNNLRNDLKQWASNAAQKL